MKYLHEFSLRKRLLDILRRHREIISIDTKQINLFAKDVVDTRNHMIHQDGSLEGQVKTGVDLYYMTEKLKHLLVICLLSEIGLPASYIKSRATRNRNPFSKTVV